MLQGFWIKGPNQQTVLYFHQGSLEQVFELGGAGEKQGGNRTLKIVKQRKYSTIQNMSLPPFIQSTESQQACLWMVCPSYHAEHLPQTRQLDAHHKIFVCAVPLAWNFLPIAAGKVCSLYSPQDSAEALSFRASSPWPIPDCLPSHNRVDYFPVFIPNRPLASEVCASLWSLSPWERNSTAGGERGLSVVSPLLPVSSLY